MRKPDSFKKYGIFYRPTKEGGKPHPLYWTWRGMIKRVMEPNSKLYYRYGGRGIKICERWLESFWNFVEDMGDKPFPSFTLERIDNDGDYCPENCKWVSRRDQRLNTARKITYVVYLGERMDLMQASRLSGINFGTLWSRLKNGDTGDFLFRKPISNEYHARRSLVHQQRQGEKARKRGGQKVGGEEGGNNGG